MKEVFLFALVCNFEFFCAYLVLHVVVCIFLTSPLSGLLENSIASNFWFYCLAIWLLCEYEVLGTLLNRVQACLIVTFSFWQARPLLFSMLFWFCACACAV